VDVQITGATVRLEFEMVVLDVGQAVAHPGFAGGDGPGPEHPAGALDRHRAGNTRKIRVDHKFGTEGTRTDF
jgi:hypothetical protein